LSAARLGQRGVGEGGEFGFTLPYAPLAEAGGGQERTWELWLRPSAGAAALRISRILDDVWDKREIFRFPEHRTAAYRAVPCYTADNELDIRLTPPA
ncbi:transferase, partial [Streptomyces sp. t39]